jgi:hypothetical protein
MGHRWSSQRSSRTATLPKPNSSMDILNKAHNWRLHAYINAVVTNVFY